VSTLAPLQLQVCQQCGAVQYPARDVCRACLGGELEAGPVDGHGAIVSWTRLHASLEPLVRDRLPLVIVSVKLAAGPVVLAHWTGAEPVMGQAVEVGTLEDETDGRVLGAKPLAAGAAP
jgi:uncharacterized OB-fold protein